MLGTHLTEVIDITMQTAKFSLIYNSFTPFDLQLMFHGISNFPFSISDAGAVVKYNVSTVNPGRRNNHGYFNQ